MPATFFTGKTKSKNLNHKGHEGTQEKPREQNLYHRGHGGTQRKYGKSKNLNHEGHEGTLRKYGKSKPFTTKNTKEHKEDRESKGIEIGEKRRKNRAQRGRLHPGPAARGRVFSNTFHGPEGPFFHPAWR
jgi:hypothetical protein